MVLADIRGACHNETALFKASVDRYLQTSVRGAPLHSRRDLTVSSLASGSASPRTYGQLSALAQQKVRERFPFRFLA